MPVLFDAGSSYTAWTLAPFHHDIFQPLVHWSLLCFYLALGLRGTGSVSPWFPPPICPDGRLFFGLFRWLHPHVSQRVALSVLVVFRSRRTKTTLARWLDVNGKHGHQGGRHVRRLASTVAPGLPLEIWPGRTILQNMPQNKGLSLPDAPETTMVTTVALLCYLLRTLASEHSPSVAWLRYRFLESTGQAEAVGFWHSCGAVPRQRGDWRKVAWLGCVGG